MPDADLADASVLTSSFYNTYIREQVVVTCTSLTRPTGVEGRVIYETDTDELRVYDGSSWIGLVPVGANLTSGWTAATGWSISITQCRREGAHCWIAGTATRTGANITVSATGDISNINPVATASGTPANGNSNTYWGLPTGATGRLAVWTFNPSNGQLALGAVSPGGDIATSDVLSFAGCVPVDVS